MATAERKAIALYDFNGEDDSQLSIKEGTSIVVIGDVTPENWQLARYNGKEGYIPDGYFEVIQKPKIPPPRPQQSSNSGETNAYSPKASAYQVRDDSSTILEEKDMFSVFVYQLEWFTIPCMFIAAALSFMYSTPSVPATKWRMALSSWATFLVAAFAAYICGVNRERFACCGGSQAITRALVFLLGAILLCTSYPVGVGSGVICLLCAFFELRLKMKGLKELPEVVTDGWCAQMFGGTQECAPDKLIICFVVLVIDAGTFAWGYIDGYNVAIEKNANDLSSWLEPTANAFMWGFARIITIHLCGILLLQCKGFLGCCLKAKLCQKICKKESDDKDDKWDAFLHRCMGYSIVVAMFLHLVCVYFTHEDSGATKSFVDAYGWETFGTGAVCLVLMASVVASSNVTLASRDARLFKQTHRQAILIIFILIAHGKGFLSTYYWMLIIAPILLWSCDLFIRYVKGD